MYIVICEHNVPSSFIDFMHSNTCFQLFKYIFVKTWIYPQIFKIVKTWKIGKTWISPPKFQNPEKTVKMRNYTPQCWTWIGTAACIMLLSPLPNSHLQLLRLILHTRGSFQIRCDKGLCGGLREWIVKCDSIFLCSRTVFFTNELKLGCQVRLLSIITLRNLVCSTCGRDVLEILSTKLFNFSAFSDLRVLLKYI